MIHAAEVQAQRILEAARQRAEGVLGEAYREGVQQGRAEAAEAMHADLIAVRNGLDAVVTELRRIETTARVRVAELAVDLGCGLAERILARAVDQDRAALVAAVRAALAVLPEPGRVHVRVHPEVQPVLRSVWRAGAEADEAIEIVADASLPPTGVVVECGLTLVDAGWDMQVAEARRRLLETSW
jgi:flagellar assembly protein FliH